MTIGFDDLRGEVLPGAHLVLRVPGVVAVVRRDEGAGQASSAELLELVRDGRAGGGPRARPRAGRPADPMGRGEPVRPRVRHDRRDRRRHRRVPARGCQRLRAARARRRRATERAGAPVRPDRGRHGRRGDGVAGRPAGAGRGCGARPGGCDGDRRPWLVRPGRGPRARRRHRAGLAPQRRARAGRPARADRRFPARPRARRTGVPGCGGRCGGHGRAGGWRPGRWRSVRGCAVHGCAVHGCAVHGCGCHRPPPARPG